MSSYCFCCYAGGDGDVQESESAPGMAVRGLLDISYPEYSIEVCTITTIIPLSSLYTCILEGTWVVISGGISRVTIVRIQSRRLITPFIATHEPPSSIMPRNPDAGKQGS